MSSVNEDFAVLKVSGVDATPQPHGESTGLPADLPLDPGMWSTDAIASAWQRRDLIDVVELMERPNVQEWKALDRVCLSLSGR